jgi:hypothetical protein
MTPTAEEQIIEKTSIPKEIREHLARFPVDELRPIRLTRYVQYAVEEFRRQGIDEDVIKAMIRITARKCGWSNPQINAALRDNRAR